MKGTLSGAAFALMFGCALAHADDTETVKTNDGSIYRGDLVEKVVNDHVTLKLVTGEIKRIEWADADFTAPVPPEPAPPASRRVPAGAATATLEADDKRATLQILPGSGTVTLATSMGWA